MTPTQDPKTPKDWQGHWIAEIGFAQQKAEEFQRRGRKIVKRFRAEEAVSQERHEGATEFNILWSNVETLRPATYARRPQVEVTRRFRDEDPVGRLAGQILERGLQYEIDRGLELHEALKEAVQDRLLPGMGAVWVRYEPAFETEEVEAPDPQNPLAVKPQQVETLSDEKTPVDYVFWEDILISPARTWADVRWVARRVPFTKEALARRFKESYSSYGGDISKVPQNYDPTQNPERMKTGDTDPQVKRTLVYEIWDKTTKQIFFICKDGCEYPLDIKPDQWDLEGFFPCPPPLRGTHTSDQFLPIADFLLYQKQAIELDTLTQRIRILSNALRIVGVYDQSQQALRNLLSGAGDNQMIPVASWAAFAEKGGLKGVVEFLPVETVAKVLSDLYIARDQCKQVIYEITGMSDIIRGASMASETLGAQEIKAKFANLRLSSRQQQVAEFVTGVLNIKAELMCTLYAPETLIRISSAELLPDARNPETLQAALALLQNEKVRGYRIEIMARSMVELDEVDERQRRTEFMETVSNFMNAAKNVSSLHPALMPVALEILKFAVRGFSVGRTLEGAIEDAQRRIDEEMKNPKPPQPDPDTVLKKEIEGIKQNGETERLKLEIASREKIEADKIGAKAASEEQARRHDELTGMVTRLHETSESRRAEDLEERRSAQEREDGFRSQLMERINQPAQDPTAQMGPIIDGIQQLTAKMEELLTASTRLKKRVPQYDPNTGDILEVQEQFIQ